MKRLNLKDNGVQVKIIWRETLGDGDPSIDKIRDNCRIKILWEHKITCTYFLSPLLNVKKKYILNFFTC